MEEKEQKNVFEDGYNCGYKEGFEEAGRQMANIFTQLVKDGVINGQDKDVRNKIVDWDPYRESEHGAPLIGPLGTFVNGKRYIADSERYAAVLQGGLQ